MDERQGCRCCGKIPEQDNRFCSPDCFDGYYEALKRLEVLEYDLARVRQHIVSLEMRIADFDEVAQKVTRLTTESASCEGLRKLHEDRNALECKASILERDVTCLRQWVESSV
jgi:hypothetical protein